MPAYLVRPIKTLTKALFKYFPTAYDVTLGFSYKGDNASVQKLAEALFEISSYFIFKSVRPALFN
jgi:hypothetical protein